MYIFSYIHLNPLSIIDKKWKEEGIKNKKETQGFLEKYQFSSYLDFLGKERIESGIIDFSLIPEYIRNMELDFKTQEQIFFKNKGTE
jgi:hypothetical protein